MNKLEEKEFEEQLQRDLRPTDAPAGFADRVMGRIAEERKGRLLTIPGGRAAWMAIAAMLVVGIAVGGWQQRESDLRERRLEARQATVYRQQLDLAMQVTGRTLVEVQVRIGRAGEIHTTERKREVEQ